MTLSKPSTVTFAVSYASSVVSQTTLQLSHGSPLAHLATAARRRLDGDAQRRRSRRATARRASATVTILPPPRPPAAQAGRLSRAYNRSVPARTWILTGSPENFAATRAHEFTVIGLKERRRRQALEMETGDRIVFYLTQGHGVRRERPNRR